MTQTTTLHLGDSDMIVFLNLIDKKREQIRRELFSKGMSSSIVLQELADLKAQFLKTTASMTSFNTF
jgi:hypothetical protein